MDEYRILRRVTETAEFKAERSCGKLCGQFGWRLKRGRAEEERRGGLAEEDERSAHRN